MREVGEEAPPATGIKQRGEETKAHRHLPPCYELILLILYIPIICLQKYLLKVQCR